MTTSPLLENARAWLAEDPDPATRAELSALLESAEAGDAEAVADLEDRFSGTLEFGTAGLRGALGAGPNRMNRVVVLRAAAGLAAYLREQGATGPVVIGYDARHNSDVFARDTAEVMTGAGIPALTLPRAMPTPVLASAILKLGASAGVMVTASHNPPQDNGYKVYLGDGCQIVPPADGEIAAHITAVGALADVPRGDRGELIDPQVWLDYIAQTGQVPPEGGPRSLDIVYTPMHGVGLETMRAVFVRAGFLSVDVVPEQAEPDPDFPTVAFPNPEEPGAMDLAFALAREKGADVVIANDPDADRCAVGVPDAEGWRMLRGDEVGALLGHDLLSRGVSGTYANSIVSSSLLGTMAREAGQPFVETLTGFKWIGRLPGLAFGYEEALGYCVDPVHVKDKDGISAAVLIADLAARLKALGSSLSEQLDEIARDYGLHATDQLSVRVSDLSLISDAMSRLRATPPTTLAGRAVTTATDLAVGTDELPATDGLRYDLDAARVIVRPSGTEPKLKCYLEVKVPVTGSIAEARASAAQQLAELKADMEAALGL
ncbi:phospho-sugar mutase [Nocardioides sp. Kera G14]|uniref:phospho-sugar mutase n=1 Tax=Nocardioides sp. Kera G14 TaxID=2884264 RepID=UPI001D108F23|nr:phospho-sugar mutase [Nocardioides sp. Kera G14]UDY24421.1 phospho-sugar mutase [Nocardioides sp. Kera G14]